MSKERIEKAFSDAGKKLADLVKACEQHGHELTEEQFNKGFDWLQVTMQTVIAKARTARTLAVAANGAFSFDMPLPAPIISSIPLPEIALAPNAAHVTPQRPPPSPARPHERPLGRLVGSKEVLFGEPEPPARLKLDPVDEINFLDPNKN
jgi:hypothetical protein